MSIKQRMKIYPLIITWWRTSRNTSPSFSLSKFLEPIIELSMQWPQLVPSSRCPQIVKGVNSWLSFFQYRHIMSLNQKCCVSSLVLILQGTKKYFPTFKTTSSLLTSLKPINKPSSINPLAILSLVIPYFEDTLTKPP